MIQNYLLLAYALAGSFEVKFSKLRCKIHSRWKSVCTFNQMYQYKKQNDLTTQGFLAHPTPTHPKLHASIRPGRHGPAWIWTGSFKSKRRVTNRATHVIFILKPKCLKIVNIFECQHDEWKVSNIFLNYNFRQISNKANYICYSESILILSLVNVISRLIWSYLKYPFINNY